MKVLDASAFEAGPLEGALWLIRLRWIAIGGVLAVLAASFFFRILEHPLPLLIIAALMVTANVSYCLHVKSLRIDQEKRIQNHSLAQIVLDLLFLTLLLHLAGGVENPLAFYFVFHMIIAGLLLPKWQSYLIAVAAVILYGAMAFLEYSGVLRHYHLRIFPHQPYHPPLIHLWQSPFYVFGLLFALSSTMAGAVYFSTTLAERLRRSLEERQALQDRVSRQEKLALVGELAAGVAHEINNPLDGVQNCFRLLREDPQALLRRPDLLDLMEDALGRIALITRRLLHLSRGLELKPQPVQVNDVVERALAVLHHQLEHKGVLMKRSLAEGLPEVHADPVYLAGVIMNLVANAIDAVAPSDIVEVETGLEARSIRIRIRDTGCGIPEELLGRIFDPFFTTKLWERGSGLGLAISRRIVEAHGGTITIESGVGRGTTVTVLLPMP